MTKRLKQKFHKRGYSNRNNYLKMYSTSLIIQEFQIKTTVTYNLRGNKRVEILYVG